MVRCNRVDGRPCKCDLSEPQIIYLLQTIVRNTIKHLLGTITRTEKLQLRAAVRRPNAKLYLEMYLEELTTHRNYIGELISDL